MEGEIYGCGALGPSTRFFDILIKVVVDAAELFAELHVPPTKAECFR